MRKLDRKLDRNARIPTATTLTADRLAGVDGGTCPEATAKENGPLSSPDPTTDEPAGRPVKAGMSRGGPTAAPDPVSAEPSMQPAPRPGRMAGASPFPTFSCALPGGGYIIICITFD